MTGSPADKQTPASLVPATLQNTRAALGVSLILGSVVRRRSRSMKSFPLPRYHQIPWAPIKAPQAGLPPIDVHFNIPREESAPSPVQLQLLDKVTEAFPTLWEIMLEGIRRDYGRADGYGDSFPILLHPERAVTEAGVYIFDWAHSPYEVDATPWTVENHLWSICPMLEGVLDLQGTQALFEGMKLISVELHW